MNEMDEWNKWSKGVNEMNETNETNGMNEMFHMECLSDDYGTIMRWSVSMGGLEDGFINISIFHDPEPVALKAGWW